ncbi:hypothetical protein N878_04735 [Pseudomonas sp. EGD-AK9]|uniref:GDP-mannose 4,6-dehydratase n=1 Tax=Pseudomonas sp. EGD-AK9 TaxID=1386078 RepID=UPI000396DC9F|nr:GDP-mannose 4,6-dehydratase [Pseudomonas sp. EGD-AK9]ERI52661.1 hypothetical protein N878_04735 [Pseudomonas sp. EGD-AK9]
MASSLLVTGLSGFVGRHVQAQLPSTWQLLQTPQLNVLDSASLNDALVQGCPDAVIHLASQTFVPESFRDPQATLQVNLLGTLNVLQALKRHGFNGSFLYVSSGDVYGRVDDQALPISELQLPQPRNPYAVSKVAAELLCQQWSYAEPWRIMVARPFNHVGPGQRTDFVVADMARQLVRVKKGLQAPRLEVGDVEVTRDFLDVRDVVSAYFSLLESGTGGEIYNVCSGRERCVRDLIEQMVQLAGVEVDLIQNPVRFRLAEQRRVVGCAEKLLRDTAWAPVIPIKQTLQDVLDEFQAQL